MLAFRSVAHTPFLNWLQHSQLAVKATMRAVGGLLVFGYGGLLVACSPMAGEPATQHVKKTTKVCTSAEQCLDECSNRIAPSCVRLADMFAGGTGGAPQDAEKAESLWQLSCDHGAATACSKLAAVAAGRNESALALLYASKACVGGDPRGCTDLGVLALHGEGTEKRRDRARALFSYACSEGEPQGCSLASWMTLEAGEPERVRRELEEACNGANYFGCAGFGLMLENGIGGPRDVGAALSAFLTGCDAGEPAACVFGGVLIEEWSQVREHQRRALMLFETGCEAPVSEPCWIEEGSEARWREHLMGDGFSRRSCDGPRARALACYNAGLGYERGVGVAMDGEKAQERFDKSCREGLARACRAAHAFVVH